MNMLNWVIIFFFFFLFSCNYPDIDSVPDFNDLKELPEDCILEDSDNIEDECKEI